jgi:hypothetical protein
VEGASKGAAPPDPRSRQKLHSLLSVEELDLVQRSSNMADMKVLQALFVCGQLTRILDGSGEDLEHARALTYLDEVEISMRSNFASRVRRKAAKGAHVRDNDTRDVIGRRRCDAVPERKAI